MPYYPRRRYAPKRKTSVKSRFRKPAAPLTMGKFKKEVKKMIYKQKERKVHGGQYTESNLVNTLDGSPDTWDTMLRIPQGDGFNNRDGNLIHLNGMAIRGFLHSNGTSVGPIGVRMAVVQHIGGDIGTDPLFTDASGNDTSTLGTGSASLHWSFNREAYKTLQSKLFILNTDAQKDNVARMFKYYVKPLVKKLRYDSSSTIDPERNIRLVVYARRLDNDEVTGTTVELTFNHTAYFVDV